MAHNAHIFLLWILTADMIMCSPYKRVFDPNTGCMREEYEDLYIRTGEVIIGLSIPLLYIPANMTDCGRKSLEEVKLTINRILEPMILYLNRRTTNHFDQAVSRRSKRFIAIGIAIAAGAAAAASLALSAGAVHMARVNRAEISAMRGDVQTLAEAQQQMTGVVGGVAKALSGLRDYVANEVVPSIERLDCQVAQNRVTAISALYLHIVSPVLAVLINNPDSAPFPFSLLTEGLLNQVTASLKEQQGTMDLFGSDPITWLREGRVTVAGVDTDSLTVWGYLSLPTYTRVERTSLRFYSCLCFLQQDYEVGMRVITPEAVVYSPTGSYRIDKDQVTFYDGKAYIMVWSGVPLTQEEYDCIDNGDTDHCAFQRCPSSVWSALIQDPHFMVVNTQYGGVGCSDPVSMEPGTLLNKAIRFITRQDCSDLTFGGVRFRFQEGAWNETSVEISKTIFWDPPRVFPVKDPPGGIDLPAIEADLARINDEMERVKTRPWATPTDNPYVIAGVVFLILAIVGILVCFCFKHRGKITERVQVLTNRSDGQLTPLSSSL